MYMCVYIQFKSIMYAIGLYKQTQQIIIFSIERKLFNCYKLKMIVSF